MKKELLSLVPEYLPLGLIVYDEEGALEYANAIALNMFGATMKDVYHINIFDDPNIGTEDKARLKKGQNVSFETDYDFDLCRGQFYDSDIKGIRKYFLTKVSIMRDADGNLQGYLLICEEVTEKKAQERKIKSTQRELALALDAGKLVAWNYQVRERMFYKFDDQIESVDRRSLEVICGGIHPDDKDRFLALLDAIIHGQELSDNNIVLRVQEEDDEDYRYCSFMYLAREDDKGAVGVVTFIRRDITEEVKFQQNLILAKNKAEEADKLKSTFLANMSHEIRTPLNAIVGFSELLSETEEMEEKVEYKQLIESNSEILLTLIGDILDLSKIEAGAVDIKRQRLDVSQLCEELYLSFKQRVKNPNVVLRLVNPYAQCFADFDKHRFIQIFTNFVTNAIKYTAQGEIVMGYECTPGRVLIYVKDTGIGIADEKKHRIFSRFEKLDNFAQGTGLGLSICKAIADVTGGEIGFDSEENVGSEFWYIGNSNVEFVEKDQLSETKVESEGLERRASAPSAEIEGLNVLVAEDNDSNYLLINTILKNNTLTRAFTGLEAVEKAQSQSFDVILMDMRMPVMNGREAVSFIRQFNQTTPIIALTANAFDSDRDDALAVGCNYFMAKPIKKRELVKLLSTLCLK